MSPGRPQPGVPQVATTSAPSPGGGRTAVGIRLHTPLAPTPLPVSPGRRRRFGSKWHRSTPAFVIAAVVAATAAVFQNFYRLSRAPILLDEPLYAGVGWRYLHWNSVASAQRGSASNNFEHPPLAKVLFGTAEVLRGQPSISAARAVSACCTVGAALILCLWLGAAVNRWVGLLAGSSLALIPMSVDPQVTRFGRDAMLDPVAQFFMVGALALGWYWFRHSGRRAWALAIAAGLSTGLATASKENGFLGLMVPVLVGLVWSRYPLTALLSRLLQSLGAALTAMATFLCCYLPFGDPAGRIAYLYRFQFRHSRNGHLIGFAGQLSSHPPWWANLWFAGHGLGPVLSCVIGLTMLVAVGLRRDRLTAWLVAAVVAPLAFHCWLAGVVLPFYWTLWTPAAVALSASGCWELCGRAGWVRSAGRPTSWSRPVRGIAALAAACALTALAVASIEQLDRVAGLQRDGTVALTRIRARLGLHGAVLATGVLPVEVHTFTGSARVYLRVPEDVRGIDTVLIGQPRCKTSSDRMVRAFAAANLRSGSLRLVRVDRLAHIYVVSGPLRAPTVRDIRAQPAVPMITGC